MNTNSNRVLVGSDPDSLLSSANHKRTDQFIRDSTAHFDSSHNWEHADKVYQNTMVIAKSLNTCYEDDILSLASKLHDVCDHKYPQSITREALMAFIDSVVGQAKRERIMYIIDNVSFSKQDRGETKELAEPDASYLTWIRDADRLEALGQIGIDRCAALVRSRHPDILDDKVRGYVVAHCHEKLLRLYNEPGFIVTEHGRHLAEPLHQIIVEYVQ